MERKNVRQGLAVGRFLSFGAKLSSVRGHTLEGILAFEGFCLHSILWPGNQFLQFLGQLQLVAVNVLEKLLARLGQMKPAAAAILLAKHAPHVASLLHGRNHL